ncbi:MAG: anthranilate synthase component I family protein [Phenylobacterium sp.]|uniref:anthranilate synthase component I family protein n=1 Tax=Phenylobacterium sp. TaxID=1871053 RepID=UPI0027331E67|nr:anthranilate synthase component I family protein [Phenylobacterium sp.]MDP3175208.1 anthranilate synthase component I family protein [Phenylobacterium sp.]
MRSTEIIETGWREPVEALAPFAEEPWTLCLLSGRVGARWSYLMRQPLETLTVDAADMGDAFSALAALAGEVCAGAVGGPPFQGGVAGLLCYELGDQVERLGLERFEGWPDVACGLYATVLAFDHIERRVLGVGRGADAAQARTRALEALGWLEAATPPAAVMQSPLQADDGCAYEAAVAEVVERIGAGEIFQANIARRWRGRLKANGRPNAAFARLAFASPAPFASYLRLPGRAVVSNSPERFLKVTPLNGALHVETQPIKGTAPRSADPACDAALAEGLAASLKDRAENLMIVDLMRNDLARVCAPGSVAAPSLFAVESFANVHHLVSTVTGVLATGNGSCDLLRAAFPPGSITGAPKVQAMRVIAGLEAPRGPFFGAMIHLGFDGAMDSSVLIRTAAFTQDEDGWRVEARAGAGIVADSLPPAERRETEAKIAALAAALRG